jgi:excisionase family DNA binding protein
MDNTQQATLAVPLSEWNELKALLAETRDLLLAQSGQRKNDLLTPAEVCRTLGISRSTFERLADSGVIPTIKLQRRKYTKVQVKRSDIDQLLKQGDI